METIADETILDVLIYKVLIPIAVIVAIKMAVISAVNYAKTLWVSGMSN